MTVIPVERHKGHDIYFNDHSEITGASPQWLVDTGYSMITLDGSLSLEEVKSWLKNIR